MRVATTLKKLNIGERERERERRRGWQAYQKTRGEARRA
jgi:hypothetical protein